MDNVNTNLTLIALGSNIEPEHNMAKALLELSNIGDIVQKTAFIYTEPLKFTEQAWFLNGAVLFRTPIGRTDLKPVLLGIEGKLGRVRGSNKHGPRPIDLDIITFNNVLVDTGICDYPFLLEFIKQLQPDIQLPEAG